MVSAAFGAVAVRSSDLIAKHEFAYERPVLGCIDADRNDQRLLNVLKTLIEIHVRKGRLLPPFCGAEGEFKRWLF